MAKLFIGIALVVMLATAALSFLAKSNIDKLQTSLKDTKAKEAVADGQTKTAKNEAEKAVKDAKEAADKAEAATALAATKTKEADDKQKALDELKLVSDGKDKQIADLNEKVGKIPNGVKPEDLAALQTQVTELTAKNGDLTKELAEKTQVIDSTVAKGKENEQALADLRKKEHMRETQLGLNGLQGRILAVNAGWNFVVLSVGDKQGVSVNAPLLVVRGNQPIAKLRITSVEPSTSIADVLPGTVPRGLSVQPGDTVIFQGRTPATQPENKPADVPVLPPVTPALPQ
jgi:hypothetical protein